MNHPARITIAAIVALPLAAQEAPRCADEPAFRDLDFWVGEWEVYAGETLAGTDRVETTLGAAAHSGI